VLSEGVIKFSIAFVGELVGYQSSGSIENSYATGNDVIAESITNAGSGKLTITGGPGTSLKKFPMSVSAEEV